MITFKAKKLLTIFLASLFLVFIGSTNATVSQDPLFLTTAVDPNVLFNMSVETPMGGAAYNDQPDGAACSGRVPYPNIGDPVVGVCYSNTKTYLGYFDPNKCYVYSSDRFDPAGPTNSNHECSGQFSGNFMNWSTMTAMDMFVWTMTGGNRVIDGANTTTVIRRTRKQNNDDWFPHKLISPSQNVPTSTVTPWGESEIYIYNTDFGVKFGTSRGGDEKGTYNVKIKVCDQSQGLEANCAPYDSGNYFKPEGLVQKNADHMRFAVTSYSNTNTREMDGGVLRSNMKYVGTSMPDGSGNTIPNPNAEILVDGTFDINPNPSDASASGVSQSGVIPYMNKFSDYGYKSYDPAGELFYESLRYYKNLGPTAEYLTGAKGDFPILNAGQWQDPIQYWCQDNFIIGINDANPWMDKKLPGTHFNSPTFNGYNLNNNDYGQPSSPDPDINVTALTNKVGALEGLNGTSQCIGCTALSCDMAATNKIIPALGEVFGTCPYAPKENSYYIAGLAYYANTEDIRTGTGGAQSFPDKQTVSTFMIDSQEYSSSPLLGRMNMLWLAGKYGGFIDENGNDEPDLTSEWDTDTDGEPDNYVLATEPQKLVTALNSAFDNIVARTSSATSVATNSTRLDTNTKIYQARFNSGDWSGQLLAFDLNNTNGTIGNQVWDAATLIPSESSRNIFTYDPDLDIGIEFEYANLNATQQALLDMDASGSTDGFGSDRADYLRGDQGNEQHNSGIFRDRLSSLMGDIINSDPWFVGRIEDFGYTNLAGTEGSDYITFRDDKKSRTPALYFGANDGMLHAIDADTGDELFTYIPDSVMSSLSNLTSPFYGCDGAGCLPHSYYVDGAPKAADAYIDTGSSDQWHSILIGSLGAGGKGFFALDITDPDTFGTSNVMWEVSTTQAPDAGDLADFQNDLGYTLTQASIVRMHTGEWAAIMANGYESADNKAVLFIINLETGEIIESFDTEVGDAITPNGLSTPIPVDEDGDRIVDSIYAGDLQGNMWKIDVTATNSNSWGFAFSQSGNPAPLYTATDANGTPQPITSKPQVGKHPDGGVMVYFGTGKYYAVNDQIVGATPQVQTFYGIRDLNAVVSSRSDLQEQTIDHEETIVITPPLPDQPFIIDVRVTSDTNVNYTSMSGWYMDLISPVNLAEGERVVSSPLLRGGRVIFTTLIPESDPCGWGGSSWLMEIDAVNGNRLTTSPFDVNQDGTFDIDDLADLDNDGVGDTEVSGIRKHGIGIIKTPGVVSTGNDTEVKYVSGSSGNLEVFFESAGEPFGRQSWRQLR